MGRLKGRFRHSQLTYLIVFMSTRTNSSTFYILWVLLVLNLFISASFLSWQLMRPSHFHYGFFYDALEIGPFIERYGPENRFKKGLENASKIEHIRLFAAIAHSVHHNGKGLAQITYHSSEGHPIGKLLRKPEVVHLEDVAKLIKLFNVAGIISIIFGLVLMLLLSNNRSVMPPAKILAAGIAGILLIVGAVVLVVGPTKVFYQLHIWIFPADHEWFFYYQDSLMTTLMKAPDLFGYIAAAWLAYSLILFVLMMWSCRWLNHKLANWLSSDQEPSISEIQ